MNIISERYYRGVNLGGWLSQCKDYTYEHYDSFIVEEDIRQIKDFGFDHVRVPFDYTLILDDANLDEYIDKGLAYLDQAIEWCNKYNLNMILDLHKAPGYSFDTKNDNMLFDDPSLQKKAIHIWTTLAKRYKDKCGEEVIFELLNEIVEPDSKRWNILADKMIRAIREIDGDRYIMVGGNNYNSCNDLQNLPVFDDDRILYTFHFYEPLMFTHQKAYWFDKAMKYNQELEYPGEYIGVEGFVSRYPEYEDMYGLKKIGINKGAIATAIAPAIEFITEHDVPLYCGEYGTIALAPMQSRINWHRDVMSILDEHRIGSGCWSYKEMDFELIDSDRKPLSLELISILARK